MKKNVLWNEKRVIKKKTDSEKGGRTSNMQTVFGDAISKRITLETTFSLTIFIKCHYMLGTVLGPEMTVMGKMTMMRTLLSMSSYNDSTLCIKVNSSFILYSLLYHAIFPLKL